MLGSDAATYAVHGLSWSALGFLAGYLLGRMSREVHEVREAIVQEHPEHAAPPHPPLLPMRRKGDRRSAVLGAFLVILAILTVASSALTLNRQAAFIACAATYSEQAARAFNARTMAAEQDRAALNALVTRVARATTTSPDPAVRRAEVNAALADYVAETAQADRERAATPFPAPPSEVCR